MLNTNKEMFTYFLDGIKKTYTGTVHPAVFTRLFNEWGMMQWIADNMSIKEGIELTTKQMDDLETLLVYKEELSHLIDNKFAIKDLNHKYFRMANIMVKVDYDSLYCDRCKRKGLSEWKKVHVMRTGQEATIRNSVFRRPSENRVYYVRTNNEVRFNTNGRVNVVKALVSYYRYPNMMLAPAPAMTPSDIRKWNDTRYDDVNDFQRKEVLNHCVRLYLERVKEERYRSFLNEEASNIPTKK